MIMKTILHVNKTLGITEENFTPVLLVRNSKFIVTDIKPIVINDFNSTNSNISYKLVRNNIYLLGSREQAEYSRNMLPDLNLSLHGNKENIQPDGILTDSSNMVVFTGMSYAVSNFLKPPYLA